MEDGGKRDCVKGSEKIEGPDNRNALMSNGPQGWDRKFKPGGGFLLLWVVTVMILGPVLWPWLLHDTGKMSAVAGILVLPFLAAAVIHTICRIVYLVLFKKEI